MSAVEEDFIAALLADAALAGLVGRRVNWITRVQGAKIPAVVLQVISAPETSSNDGPDDLLSYLVQVDCWGGTYLSAKTVARAVRGVCVGMNAAPLRAAFIENKRDGFEPGDGPQPGGAVDLYRVSLDVRVWHG